MKPTKISVSYGKTVNTGNFNSLRLDAGMEVELEPNENPSEVYAKAFAAVKNIVAAEAAK